MRKFLELIGGLTLFMFGCLLLYSFTNKEARTALGFPIYAYAEPDTPTVLLEGAFFPIEYLMNMGEMHILNDTFTTAVDTIVFVEPDDYIVLKQYQHKRLTGQISISNYSLANNLLVSNDYTNWKRIYPNGGSISLNPFFEDTLFCKAETGTVPSCFLYTLPRWTGK